jgi:hypothetical protein
MRVSVGDILTYSAAAQSTEKTYDALEKLCQTVYVPAAFDRLKRTSLEATYTTATVYCLLFQNMTQKSADELHLKLEPMDFYLGCMGVDFSRAFHLQFFRNSLIERYRLVGKTCTVFYAMGENEDRDLSIKEAFERSSPVMHLLLRYTQALITQMAQTAVCNRHHCLDQQLCRWLLLSLDRLTGEVTVPSVTPDVTPDPVKVAEREADARVAAIKATDTYPDYATLQAQAQRAVFTPDIDKPAVAGSAAPGWVCPTHGAKSTKEQTSRKGRTYRVCTACPEFEK